MNRPTTYTVDARYGRHVEAALRLALTEAARDAVYRADTDVVALRKVDDALYDMEATGVVIITIEPDPMQQPAVPDVDHYKRVGIPRPEEKVDRP